MSKRRFIILVLDGLGVGAMDDVAGSRPQDVGAHTLGNLLRVHPHIKLPNFQAIGALEYFIEENFTPQTYLGKHVSFGAANLAHFGADSYVGHQEIAGTLPKLPVRQFVRDIKDEIVSALSTAGFTARFDHQVVIVEDHIVVADNIETDYGLNINVIGSLDHYDYSVIEKVGRTIRELVKVGRVITMGGTGINLTRIFDKFAVKERDGYTAWGIDVPALGIYNDKYQVVHMGYGINPETQTPQIASKAGKSVVLIGKAADVIVAKGAKYLPQVYTDKVLALLLEHLADPTVDFIFANVQETDLSGHEMDAPKYARYLEMVDQKLPELINALLPDDVLIITGDHGNDPTIGHTNHTRERTPIMMFSAKHGSQDIGQRSTLSDIGASAATYLQVKLPEHGTAFISQSRSS